PTTDETTVNSRKVARPRRYGAAKRQMRGTVPLLSERGASTPWVTLRSIPNGLSTRSPPDGGATRACPAELPRRAYFFFVRVAPPRPRSVTPVSERTRCTSPWDRPVDWARARMLAPFSYFFLRSVASLSRWAPVMRAPFFRSATALVPSSSSNSLVRAGRARVRQ